MASSISGKKVQVLSGHKDWINSCCVSPDCSMMASVGRFDRVSSKQNILPAQRDGIETEGFQTEMLQDPAESEDSGWKRHSARIGNLGDITLWCGKLLGIPETKFAALLCLSSPAPVLDLLTHRAEALFSSCGAPGSLFTHSQLQLSQHKLLWQRRLPSESRSGAAFRCSC